MKIPNLMTTQSTLLIGEILPEILQKYFKISSQDFFVLEDYKIENIKELIHFVNLKPYNSVKRLAVILEAETLSPVCANALLKTLEEPPKDSIIILTTKNEQKILPTILSRCQKIRLGAVQLSKIPENYQDPKQLAKLSIADKFKWVAAVFETQDVKAILTHHQEYFRQQLLNGSDVLSLLKQISFSKDLLGSNISVKLLLENLIMQYPDGE